MVEEEDMKSFKVDVNCKNGDLSVSAGDYTYTEEEQKTLQSQDHCLYKFAYKLNDNDYDVGKCEKGLLTDSTKNSGVSCGTIVFNMKFDSSKSFNYKTCFLFNVGLYSSVVSIINNSGYASYINLLAIQIAKEMGYEKYESFTAEFYNENGSKVKYDSTNGKFEVVDNLGNLLKYSKYLFLLIFGLF